jgi:hypothetical protein
VSVVAVGLVVRVRSFNLPRASRVKVATGPDGGVMATSSFLASYV